MTDLRKAAEQALEALENIDRWLPTIGQRGLRDYEADAIQALRQALVQPEQEPAVKWDASAPLVLDCPRCGHCCQKREWVGFTDGEKRYFRALGYVGIDDIEDRLKRINI